MTNDNREFRNAVQSLCDEMDNINAYSRQWLYISAELLKKRPVGKPEKPSKETMKMIQSIIQGA